MHFMTRSEKLMMASVLALSIGIPIGCAKSSPGTGIDPALVQESALMKGPLAGVTGSWAGDSKKAGSENDRLYIVANPSHEYIREFNVPTKTIAASPSAVSGNKKMLILDSEAAAEPETNAQDPSPDAASVSTTAAVSTGAATPVVVPTCRIRETWTRFRVLKNPNLKSQYQYAIVTKSAPTIKAIPSGSNDAACGDAFVAHFAAQSYGGNAAFEFSIDSDGQIITHEGGFKKVAGAQSANNPKIQCPNLAFQYADDADLGKKQQWTLTQQGCEEVSILNPADGSKTDITVDDKVKVLSQTDTTETTSLATWNGQSLVVLDSTVRKKDNFTLHTDSTQYHLDEVGDLAIDEVQDDTGKPAKPLPTIHKYGQFK